MKRIGLVLALLIVALIGVVLLRIPRNDRTWVEEQRVPVTAEILPTKATLHTVRDWTYDAAGPVTKDWPTITVDPNTVRTVWFVIEPFSTSKTIAHTFLSFEFENGETLDFSVESRLEENELYSPLKGLFNEYELSYEWGTERDFIARRLVYLQHPLRMYPLALTKEDNASLFRALLEETNAVAAHPRFYNTLTANCTDMLAKIVNKYYPDRLPYDISWNLTGLADGYLMREGLIEQRGKTSDAIKTSYDLTPYRADVSAHATSSTIAFSAFIRTLIPH